MSKGRTVLLGAVVLIGGAVIIAAVSRSRVATSAGLLAVVWLACVSLLVADGLTRVFAVPKARRTNIRVAILGTFAAILAGEVFVRMTARQLATYPEQNGLPYRSAYATDPRPLHLYLPGQTIQERKPEFVHERTMNSLGLADREYPAAKAPNEFRILALGDSFTEGVGAAPDASWVRVMEREVQALAPGWRITAINAGVSGSDPYEQHQILKLRLLPLQPDLVIVALNVSDINEMLVRGGRERFQSDGSRRFRSAPAWEPVYALSYLFRLLVHSGMGYNRFLIRQDRMAAELRAASDNMRSAIGDIQELCAANGMRLLLITHPSEFEVARGAYGFDYSRVLPSAEGNASVRVGDLLRDFAAERTITPENARQYFWPLDHHPNTEGYAIAGRAIAKHVVAMGLPAPPGRP